MSFNKKDNKMGKFVSFWSLEGKIWLNKTRNFQVFKGYTWNAPLKIKAVLNYWLIKKIIYSKSKAATKLGKNI